jgi:IclR family acetate operon transcriptional repressor
LVELTINEPQAEAVGVRAVSRAVQVLEALADEPAGLGVAELARRTRLGLATCHRLLNTLILRDYVVQHPDTARYLLGYRIFELAERAHGPVDTLLLAQALPILRDLTRASGETSNLAVPDGTVARFAAQIASPASMRMVTVIGSRIPLHCTAGGKVLLAHADPTVFEQIVAAGLPRHTQRTIVDPQQLALGLEMIRRDGIAIDNEEFEDGLTCAAAPVFDYRGRVIAAVSVSGPTARVSRDLPRLQPLLLAKADRLSSRLGFKDREAGAEVSP